MDAQAIKRALRKLAERGWEIRVPLARRGDGSPVYAFRGRRSTYRVPVFPSRTDHPMGVAGDPQTGGMPVTGDPQTGVNAGHRRPPNGGEWGSFVNGMGVTSAPPSPHTPYLSSSARARETTPDPSGPREEEEKKNKNQKTARTPVEIIRAHTDATPTEAAALLDRLTHEHRIDHLTAWLTTAATNGTPTQHLANHPRPPRPTRTDPRAAHTPPTALPPFPKATRKKEASSTPPRNDATSPPSTPTPPPNPPTTSPPNRSSSAPCSSPATPSTTPPTTSPQPTSTGPPTRSSTTPSSTWTATTNPSPPSPSTPSSSSAANAPSPPSTSTTASPPSPSPPTPATTRASSPNAPHSAAWSRRAPASPNSATP